MQVLLDVIEDLPDGARYLPLGPGSIDPDRDPDVLSPKGRFEVLIHWLECYVLDARHRVNRELRLLNVAGAGLGAIHRRRGPVLRASTLHYSPSCREGVFSESGLPA